LQVERLADHWLRVLPNKVMEVAYEDIVADLEGESRRLIEFLGLEWEPACLEFHKTERPVLTASHWQVRQPLYGRVPWGDGGTMSAIWGRFRRICRSDLTFKRPLLYFDLIEFMAAPHHR
jgi:hypothetical protein